jgi:hypothetical protein
MTILYIANTSKQHHDFLYRIPEEVGRTRVQKIPMGEQIRIHKEDTLEVLMAIVDQHARYGLTAADEVDRTKPFIGLLYQFDKPIQIEKFMYADEHNAGVYEEVGREIRQTAAAALHNQIEQVGDSQLQNLQSEVVEETRETDRGLNEVVEVNRDPTGRAHQQSRRDKRKGR